MSRTATWSVTVIPPTINPLTHAPYREAMTQMVRTVLALPYEDVWIQSDDGLHLHGKYYAGRPGALVQIMMHGYKSGAERDFRGADRRAGRLSRSAGRSARAREERGQVPHVWHSGAL